ncbi:MAG: hypothetical protein ACK4NS_11060 [Saprospiraceae bacterium]
MSNFRVYIAIGVVVLLLSWSDFSRFCSHSKGANDTLNVFLQTKIDAAPEDTLLFEYEDDPDIIEIADIDDTSSMHASDWADEADQKLLHTAAARMAAPDDPVELSWEALADVKYKKKYNEEYEQYFDYPVFGAKLKALNHQKVAIKGYMIPLDVGVYALSRYPYAACFFCGGAGPETIAGLKFAKSPKRYKTDDFVTLQGVFILNDSDVNNFMYQLYAVEQVK